MDNSFNKNRIQMPLLIVMLNVSLVLAQEPSPTISDSREYIKSIFVQLGFNGTGLTGNFDMRFKPGRNDGWGFRVGTGTSGYVYFTKANVHEYLTFPVGINYLAGRKSSQFESGIGIRPQIAAHKSIEGDTFWFDGFLNLGYRFQPKNGGLMFRVNWTPDFDFRQVSLGGAGLSVGYSYSNIQKVFKKSHKVPKTIQPDGKHRKSIFVEGLGNGGLLSANFDMRFKPDHNNGLGFRAGIGMLREGLTLPLNLNYIMGKSRSGFETGIGITPAYGFSNIRGELFYPVTTDRKLDALGFLNLGYRFQPVRSGLLFRINLAKPLDADRFYHIRAGLSLGYSFK